MMDYIDESAPLTREQWDRLIAYYRLMYPRQVPGLVAAQQFQAAMTQIQQSAGQTRVEVERLHQAWHAMTHEEA